MPGGRAPRGLRRHELLRVDDTLREIISRTPTIQAVQAPETGFQEVLAGRAEVMRDGHRLHACESLAAQRERAVAELEAGFDPRWGGFGAAAGVAAVEKPGRLPRRSAARVNWLTTRADPPMSRTDRFILP